MHMARKARAHDARHVNSPGVEVARFVVLVAGILVLTLGGLLSLLALMACSGHDSQPAPLLALASAITTFVLFVAHNGIVAGKVAVQRLRWIVAMGVVCLATLGTFTILFLLDLPGAVPDWSVTVVLGALAVGFGVGARGVMPDDGDDGGDTPDRGNTTL